MSGTANPPGTDSETAQTGEETLGTDSAAETEAPPIPMQDTETSGDPTEDPTDDPTEDPTEDPTDSPTTGMPGECDPGDTQDCYTGPAGTQDVGTCAAGAQTCSDEGVWGACEGEILPGTESCDGTDENCDGVPDDGDPGGGAACNTGLSGACQSGTLVCEDGDLACDPDVEPAASEVCGNGVDDDCNGTPDDGCICDPSAPQLDCAAGEHCYPTESGDTVCQGPSGLGGQYDVCAGDGDCGSELVCVNAGVGSVYCMEWCTSAFDCPGFFDDCVPLDPSVFVGLQEWGVCYDGLG